MITNLENSKIKLRNCYCVISHQDYLDIEKIGYISEIVNKIFFNSLFLP